MAKVAKKVGRRVGRYQLLERIPGGGMTEVYRARVAGASGPERPLVLKMLPARASGAAEAEARFVEEAKIALALTHGNIVSTFEAGRDEAGQLFLVMEYVHGCSLRELLDRGGALPLASALFIARETARALRFTHNYVEPGGEPTPHAHLDVSPENILLSHTGQVKLTDFGIARAVGAGRRTRAAFGKPAYVAPEILGGATGGPAADLYGLGCVIYELLTGEPPRKGESFDATLKLVRDDRPIVSLSPADFPPELCGAVATLLATEPSARGDDAFAFERTFTTLLAAREQPFTEPELAELLRARGAIPEGALGSSAGRLAAQLAEAGAKLEGVEGTAELLALGTVPLALPEAASDLDTELSGTRGPVSRGGRWVAPLLGAGAMVGLTALALLFPWSGERRVTPGVEVGPGLESGAEAMASRSDARLLSVDPGVGLEVEPSRPPIADPVGTQASGRKLRRPSIRTPPPRSGGEGEAAAGTETAAKDPGPSAIKETGRDAPEPPPEPAHLQINAYPYAEVWTERGQKLGDTPLRDLRLPPGKQRLRLVNRELHLETWVELDLAPGEEKTVGVRLDR